jgi:mercuric ion binding protein
MRRFVQFSLLTIATCLLTAAVSRAESKVTISGTHLCCGQCLKAVDATLKDMAGVKFESSQDAKTIAIKADNDEAAQKAVDALAAAGFYGKLDNDKIKYKTVSAPEGSVEKIEVSGIHNCCGACTKAITTAVKAVPGVTGAELKAKQTTFTVEGKFKASELVDALLKAGFYAQVKK